MRGEKSWICIISGMISGSSPHARGKGLSSHIKVPDNRIIPACAGKVLE